MRTLPRGLAIAVWFGVAVALASAPARAAGPPVGAKNFSPPPTTPDHFSNETGPMLGGTADSRKDDPVTRPTVAAPSQYGSSVAVARHGRVRHVATVRGRVRFAQARGGHFAGHAEVTRRSSRMASRTGHVPTTHMRTTHMRTGHTRG